MRCRLCARAKQDLVAGSLHSRHLRKQFLSKRILKNRLLAVLLSGDGAASLDDCERLFRDVARYNAQTYSPPVNVIPHRVAVDRADADPGESPRSGRR